MKELYKMQADVCKVIANPVRMELIDILKGGEKSVSELVDATGLHKANISQHLSLLKSSGVADSRRDGQNIYYSISNRKILDACSLMREVLVEQLESQQVIINKIKAS